MIVLTAGKWHFRLGTTQPPFPMNEFRFVNPGMLATSFLGV